MIAFIWDLWGNEDWLLGQEGLVEGGNRFGMDEVMEGGLKAGGAGNCAAARDNWTARWNDSRQRNGKQKGRKMDALDLRLSTSQ